MGKRRKAAAVWRLTDEQRAVAAANTRLIGATVRAYFSRVSQRVGGNEVYAAGRVGLLRAAHKFDPARGHKFSTFAMACIRNTITQFLRWWFKKPVQIPASVMGWGDLDHRPADGRRVLKVMPDTAAEDEEWVADVKDRFFAAAALNKRYRTVVRWRGRGETLDEVGRRLGVTRERVRQMEAVVWAKWRKFRLTEWQEGRP